MNESKYERLATDTDEDLMILKELLEGEQWKTDESLTEAIEVSLRITRQLKHMRRLVTANS